MLLSKPTTIGNAFVIGLRYMKRDGTYTEDHFSCLKDREASLGTLEIQPHYRGQIEFNLPEYRGTHKHQTDLSQPLIVYRAPTEVNTITFFKSQK